ncbi:MAG: hypothetical protein WBG90_08065 [Saonia sp.]
MRILVFCFILSLHGFIGIAQVDENEPFTTSSEDIGFFGESRAKVYHFDLLQEYSLSQQFSVQLQGIYERVGLGGTYHFPLLGKYYVTKKGYLLGGPAVDFYQNEASGQIRPTRLSGVLGAGYDVKENFFLQAQGDFTIQRFSKKFDRAPRPNMLTLSSGFKF